MKLIDKIRLSAKLNNDSWDSKHRFRSATPDKVQPSQRLNSTIGRYLAKHSETRPTQRATPSLTENKSVGEDRPIVCVK